MGKAAKLKQGLQVRAKRRQSDAKAPQARGTKKPQSRGDEKPPQSRMRTPKAAHEPGEVCNPYSPGWKACLRHMSKDYQAMSKPSKDYTTARSTQLIHINECSAVLSGVQAEVNWYIGGNGLADLPDQRRAVQPGVYLAKAAFWPSFLCEGPDDVVADMTELRWLGSTSELLATTKACRSLLGKAKYDRLVHMLTFNCETQP